MNNEPELRRLALQIATMLPEKPGAAFKVLALVSQLASGFIWVDGAQKSIVEMPGNVVELTRPNPAA